MSTAKAVIESLAEALGATSSKVEAYGLALRRMGWWAESKRGRGARALTSMEASKLLLAVMSDGPGEIGLARDGYGFMLDYANACLCPTMRDDKIVVYIREQLGLSRSALFLDYVDGLVRLFRDGRTDDLIFFSASTEGFLPPYRWDGPNVDVRISGPMPFATIELHLSHSAIDALVARGSHRDHLLGKKTIGFMHRAYGWAADAREDPEADADQEEAYDNLIEVIQEKHARGVRFERSIGGREIAAVARALAPEEPGQ